MKKSLSLLLAIAMVFSMFASVAMAAEADLTTQQKYDALHAAGIFAGYEDGTAGLDKEMTRAQFARVVALVLDLDVDTKPAASKFTDVKLTHWAVEEIHAVDAEGVMNGKGNGIFDPEGKVTIEQMARVLVDALGLKVEEKVAAIEDASPWAQGYVAAAVENGLLSADLNFKANATRALLVEASFTAYETLKPEPAEQGIASATATGAKKVEVKFNQAIADTSKVTISLKKGSVTTNVKEVTYSTDKKSATVELAVKLTKGDYTVTVNGLGDKALTKDFTADDEKVTKVEFTSLNAVLDRVDADTVYANFAVHNQYDEDVTADGGLTFSAGKGVPTPDYANGVLQLKAAVAYTKDEKINVSALHTASTTFTSGVLVVVDPARVSSLAIKSVWNEDGDAPEADAEGNDFYLLIEAKDQYGNTMTDKDEVNADVVATNNTTNLFDQFDQDPLAHPFDNKDDHVALQLPAGALKAGTARVTIVPKLTGKLATFEFAIAEKSKVDVFNMSQPAAVAAGDKSVEIPFTAVDQFGNNVTSLNTLQTTVQLSTSPSPAGSSIGFVRDYVKGVNKLVLDTTNINTSSVTITAIANGKVTLLTIPLKDARKATVIAGIKDFTKVFAKDADADLKLANIIIHDQYGVEFTSTDFGATAGKFQISVKSSAEGKVELSGTETAKAGVHGLDHANDAVNLKGKDKGNSTITLEIVKVKGALNDDIEAVAGSSYTFTAKTVDKSDIVSYELADVAKVFTIDQADPKAPDYAVDFEINGVLADGSKVVIPDNGTYFTAKLINSNSTDNDGEVTLVGTTITATDAAVMDKDKDTTTATLIVTVNASNGGVLTKTVTITDAAPALSKIFIKSDGKTTVEDEAALVASVALADINNTATPDNHAAVLAKIEAQVAAIVKGEDQYGVSATPTIADTIITNATDGKETKLDKLVAGNTFSATVITTDSKVLTIKFIVK